MLLSSTRLCLIASVSLVQAYLESRMITASDLAIKYNFNARSINPSLTRLVRVGILRSQVGGKGRGFVLAKDPREITLFDVVNSLEGSNALLRCTDMMYGVKCSIGKCEDCKLYTRMNQLCEDEANVLRSISLYEHYVSSLSGDKAEIARAEDLLSGRTV